MKILLSARTRAMSALCIGAMAVAGCASSGSTSGGAGSDSSNGSSSGAADSSVRALYTDGLHNASSSQGTPVKGGTLRVAEYSEAVTLNPTQTYPTGATGMNVLASVYDTLMRYDPESKSYVPQLAKSLVSSDKGDVWTLHLRPGVNFTDGTPLNAKAVIGSINYYLAGHGLNFNLIQSGLKSMKAANDHTVVFTFKEPWGSFPDMLAGGPGLIMAPAAYAHPAAFKPIGAGPFVLSRQTPGVSTVVTANDKYFAGRPYLDKIDFVLLGADSAKYDSLKAGEVDEIYVSQESVIKQVAAAGYPLSMNAVGAAPILTMNLRPGRATSDIRVRQAISLALNADIFLQRSTGSADLATRSLMGPTSVWKTTVPPVQTDAAEAKKLLAQAKAHGFNGQVTYLSQSDTASTAGAVAIQAMLEAVGFKVKLDLVNTVTEQVKKIYVDGSFDLARSSVSIADADPYAGLDNALDSTSPVNAAHYSSPAMDKLLAQLRGVKTPTEGRSTMTAIETLWKKDVPYVNMGAGGFAEAWAKDVHGIQPTANTAVLYGKAWIGKG